MRAAWLVGLAACSNAAGAAPDAPPDDAVPPIDAIHIDAATTLGLLVINEVAAAGSPDDWLEVVNATGAPLDASQFVYVDTAGDFAKARAFPAMTLAPGERLVQVVSDEVSGFKLGSDEALWVYRAADQALSDGVDWDEGASPVDGSFARIPDTAGTFQTVIPATPGAPNS